jgi:hypothetical protein
VSQRLHQGTTTTDVLKQIETVPVIETVDDTTLSAIDIQKRRAIQTWMDSNYDEALKDSVHENVMEHISTKDWCYPFSIRYVVIQKSDFFTPMLTSARQIQKQVFFFKIPMLWYCWTHVSQKKGVLIIQKTDNDSMQPCKAFWLN